MSHGFPKRARLLRPAEYRRVFGKACRVSDDAFTMLARHAEGDTARLGMAISKRNVPRAVDRNRIKRIGRESFRHQRPGLPVFDVILLARPPARALDRKQLHRKLNALLQRLVRRCGES